MLVRGRTATKQQSTSEPTSSQQHTVDPWAINAYTQGILPLSAPNSRFVMCQLYTSAIGTSCVASPVSFYKTNRPFSVVPPANDL